jgi:ABC-type nitrate/sulfonate/bicarbonate transport system substrate-binding protein
MQAIGVVFDRSLACFMVRDEDKPITNPADFQPKKVGVYKDYDTSTIYHWLMTRYHLDKADETPQWLEPEDPAEVHVSLLEHGTVDVLAAYVTNEPLVAKREHVPVLLLTPEEFGLPYYSDTIIANKSVLNSSDIGKRFLRASAEGWRYALHNQDEAAEIVVAHQDEKHELYRDQELDVIKKLASYVEPNDAMFAMDNDVWKSMEQVLLSRTRPSLRNLRETDPSLKSLQGCDKRLCDFDIAKQAKQ